MDNVVSQQIPHDSEAEKAVLGAVFLNPAVISDLSDTLGPDDFYERANRIVFNAMLNLDERNEKVDVITIQDELNKNNQLEDIGGLAYISELAVTTPTSAHVSYYAQIIKRKSLLRHLIATSQGIIQTAMQENDDVTDILDQAESAIMSVSQENTTGGFREIKQVLLDTVQQIETASNNDSMITGLPTGFFELDRMTTGFHDNELIILAARPGVGKTAFALNIAENVGMLKDKEEKRKSVAIFSLEMGADQLAQRMIASIGLIDSQHLRTGRLEEDEWRKLYTAAGVLGDTEIYIDDTPGIKMSDIRAKSRRLAKEKGNLGLIVIDYLQLIEGPKSESRQQEVSAISRQLKKLAKELHVPVIALSQLSRSVEQRQDKRPVLSDIRESGSIEQDADIVAFLYRDDYYRDEREDGDDEGEVTPEDDNGEVEVIIEKNRSGSRGTIKLMFSKPYNRFSNLDYVHQEQN